MRAVGIIGGMGPQTTVLLMQRVMDAVGARNDADHVPLIVHQNPQVPSPIEALIKGEGRDPMSVLIAMAQDLERAGAQALAMPCNTAHYYAFALVNATSLPFLDMLELAAMRLSRIGARRVGMLASPALRQVAVVEPYCERHGLVPVWLDDDGPLLDLIRAVKAGTPAATLAPALAAAAARLADAGADHLLVACTELSKLTGGLPDMPPWIDSLDCLCAEIIRFSRRA